MVQNSQPAHSCGCWHTDKPGNINQLFFFVVAKNTTNGMCCKHSTLCIFQRRNLQSTSQLTKILKYYTYKYIPFYVNLKYIWFCAFSISFFSHYFDSLGSMVAWFSSNCHCQFDDHELSGFISVTWVQFFFFSHIF